jgi:hypothetical protein
MPAHCRNGIGRSFSGSREAARLFSMFTTTHPIKEKYFTKRIT